MSLRHNLRTLAAGRAPPARERLGVPARRPSPRASPRERMARYDDAYPVDLVIVGAGAGGGDARAAARAPRLEGGRTRGRAVLGPGRGLGVRRGGLAPAVLDRGPGHRRLGPGRARQEQLRAAASAARWSTTPATAPASIPPTSRCTPATGWGRTGRSPTRTSSRTTSASSSSCRWPATTGRGATRTAIRTRRTRSPGARMAARGGARKLGIEMRVGPVGITNGAFGNRPHCIYRGFCLQGCKVNAKASPLVTHIPTRSSTAPRSARTAWSLDIEVDDASGRVTGVQLLQRRGSRAPPARRRGRGRGLLDRDPAPAAQLDQRAAFPTASPTNNDQVGPLRDGPGRPAGRRPLPGGDAHVQGAAAGDLLRAVLRDRRSPRLRARVLDPDRRPAADRARATT